MEVDIQEMTGEALALDIRSLKSEIVTEVMQRIADEQRLDERLKQERALRTTALNRPQDLV